MINGLAKKLLVTLKSDCNSGSRSRDYKAFLCSTQLSMKFQLLIKTKILKIKNISCLYLSC